MTKTITQTVTFKGASAKDIYGIYMNSKKVGEKWTAHKGELRGTNLMLKANKTVVQTWRMKGWKADSILTLQFDDTAEGCEMTMVHALVPEDAAAEIKNGWTKMYWKPIKGYLKTAN